MMVRIFYRNRSGKDTKVVGWSQVLHDPAQFRGALMSDPANQYVSYADIDIAAGDVSYQATDQYGAFTKKVVDGALVARDQADLDKDKARKPHLIQLCEDQIAVLINGREKATMLMFAAQNLYAYMKALQEALAIQDSSLSAAGQQAKGTLEYLKQTFGDPTNTYMAQRDAALALLDQED